ncbi:MAG TPA: serine/threonine-protein kinase [Solirubrobacteraceae bacterium]
MTATLPPPVLATGARVGGDYEVVELLRRSPLFDVYDVHSDSRDCRCVAKLPRPDRAGDERTRRRLVHEGRLLLSFTHPHLVRAYELIEAPEPVLILETLSGETLAHLLARSPRGLPTGDLALLGLQLCSALHYLHGRGIVHLDLKPTNVVIDCGKAKLLDLSVARPPGTTRGGAGSRRYAAPEQIRGGEVGTAADVWGAGCVLHEVATGRRAFEARRDGYEQLERRAEPVATACPGLPRTVAAVIDAALDPAPDARPSVAELADVLDDALPG